MEIIAYNKLLEAITNDELVLYFELDNKYLVVDKGLKGMEFTIDYYAMAQALNKFIINNPNELYQIKKGILKTLNSSKPVGIRTIIEIIAFQLRYKDNLLFIDEEILLELKKQIHLHKNVFINSANNYKGLDDLVYKSSGIHFI